MVRSFGLIVGSQWRVWLFLKLDWQVLAY